MSEKPEKQVVHQGDQTPLPPPGDARNEELKRRHDELLAKADELGKLMEQEGIDPKNWRVERDESVRPMDPDLAVKHPRADHKYAWIYRDPWNRYGNRVVHSYEREGFTCVLGGDDDAKGMKIGPENAVINADCCLMRIKKDVKAAMEAHQRAHRVAREEGIPADLLDAAMKRGAKVTVGQLPQGAQQIVGASAQAMTSRQLRNQQARRMATTRLDQAIRAGRIPGMEMRNG